ncbi:hypothetical protein D3C74_213550 [compost metagenome]
MFKLVPTNDCHVEVYIQGPWFGELTADQANRMAHDISDQIRRHVDDIDGVTVVQKRVYRDSDGVDFESLYDALEYRFDEYGALEKLMIRYERPNDKGIGTRVSGLNFEQMIEIAWNNPWKFEVVDGPELTEAQERFLHNVLDASLEQKLVKEANTHE